MRVPKRLQIWTLLVALFLLGCTESLNWREVSLLFYEDGVAVGVVHLPSKPTTQTRTLPLAGEPRELRLLASSVQGRVFAVGSVKVSAEAQVASVQKELLQAMLRNLGQKPEQITRKIEQLIPDVLTARSGKRIPVYVLEEQGVLPSGEAGQLVMKVFALHGIVYELLALGPKDEVLSDAAAYFMTSLVLY